MTPLRASIACLVHVVSVHARSHRLGRARARVQGVRGGRGKHARIRGRRRARVDACGGTMSVQKGAAQNLKHAQSHAVRDAATPRDRPRDRGMATRSMVPTRAATRGATRGGIGGRARTERRVTQLVRARGAEAETFAKSSGPGVPFVGYGAREVGVRSVRARASRGRTVARSTASASGEAGAGAARARSSSASAGSSPISSSVSGTMSS